MMTTVAVVLATTAVVGASPAPAPSVLGFVPNVASLEEIAIELGEADVVEDVSGGERRRWLCYVSEAPGDPTSLVFESGLEGGWTIATEYVLRKALPKRIRRDQCGSSRLVTKTLALSNGLRLGLSVRDAIRRVASVPGQRSASRVTYERRYSVRPSKEQAAALQDAHGGVPPPEGTLITGHVLLDLRFDHGRLVEIRVRRTEVL